MQEQNVFRLNDARAVRAQGLFGGCYNSYSDTLSTLAFVCHDLFIYRPTTRNLAIASQCSCEDVFRLCLDLERAGILVANWNYDVDFTHDDNDYAANLPWELNFEWGEKRYTAVSDILDVRQAIRGKVELYLENRPTVPGQLP